MSKFNFTAAFAALSGLSAASNALPGPKAQVLAGKVTETVSALEDAADELAVDAANTAIEALAARGHVTAIEPAVEGIVDPLVADLADFFKARILGKPGVPQL